MVVSNSAWRGIGYAFGRGLDPRKKDGVRAHPFVFLFGVLLHVAIASAVATLLLQILNITLPPATRITLLLLQAIGLCSGLALIVRRLREPVLQAISVADDYVSAVLVILFLIAAAVSLATSVGAAPLYVCAAALALYAPFGKIRHCVLFFVTRARFGAFVGTRGVLIHRSHG